MLDSERDYALMEAHRIEAYENYFDNRPSFISKTKLRVFEAAFKLGWDAAKADKEKQNDRK